MSRTFKPKNMRRILLFMALIFPVVYLCGGLFSLLKGAHGTNDWHENTLVQPKTYQDAMRPESFSYDDWIWTNEYGTRLGFSLGSLHLEPSSNFNCSFNLAFNGVNFYSDGLNSATVDDLGLGYPDPDSYINFNYEFSLDEDSCKFYSGEIAISDFSKYFCVFAVCLDSSDFVIFWKESEFSYAQFRNGAWGDISKESYSLVDTFLGSSSLTFYFDDLSCLQGYDTMPSLFKEASKPILKKVESDSLSDYLFSSPFASNNFVSAVGRDVMQGNADGFAPMNDLFKVVNDNVLHFDEADSLAVFGFGYLYYAVNVIVIYEVVSIALKLLLLPLKVVDNIEVSKND